MIKETKVESVDGCKDACLNERSRPDPCDRYTMEVENSGDKKCSLKSTNEKANLKPVSEIFSAKMELCEHNPFFWSFLNPNSFSLQFRPISNAMKMQLLMWTS